MRPFLSVLCVVMTLACPHLCAAKQAAAASWGEPEAYCCEECRAETGRKDKPSDAPSSDRDDRGCFCDGAAFDVGGRISIDHPMAFAWSGLEIPALCLDGFSAVTGFEELAPPPPISGRIARITFASLLL